jgi:uncharacterized membrane protein
MKARYLWFIYFIASLIIMSAISRLIGVGEFLATGETADPDNRHYASHLLVTLLHLIPGTFFIVLGPLQFVSAIRNRWPAFHRVLGRLLVICGLMTAVTALVMNATFPPVGGTAKSIAVVMFSLFDIAAFAIAWRAIMKGQVAKHRDWMIRAYAILLSVSTARFFFIPYFIFYGMPNNLVIDTGMCSAFLVNWVMAEVIINKLNRKLVKGT